MFPALGMQSNTALFLASYLHNFTLRGVNVFTVNQWIILWQVISFSEKEKKKLCLPWCMWNFRMNRNYLFNYEGPGTRDLGWWSSLQRLNRKGEREADQMKDGGRGHQWEENSKWNEEAAGNSNRLFFLFVSYLYFKVVFNRLFPKWYFQFLTLWTCCSHCI